MIDWRHLRGVLRDPGARGPAGPGRPASPEGLRRPRHGVVTARPRRGHHRPRFARPAVVGHRGPGRRRRGRAADPVAEPVRRRPGHRARGAGVAAVLRASAARPRRRLPGRRDDRSGGGRRPGDRRTRPGPSTPCTGASTWPSTPPAARTPASCSRPCRRRRGWTPPSGTSRPTSGSTTGRSSSRRRPTTCSRSPATWATVSTSLPSPRPRTAASCSTCTTSGPTSATDASRSRTTWRRCRSSGSGRCTWPAASRPRATTSTPTSGPVDPELLELAARVVPRLPRVRAVIYEAVPVSLAGAGGRGAARRAVLHPQRRRAPGGRADARATRRPSPGGDPARHGYDDRTARGRAAGLHHPWVRRPGGQGPRCRPHARPHRPGPPLAAGPAPRAGARVARGCPGCRPCRGRPDASSWPRRPPAPGATSRAARSAAGWRPARTCWP